MAAIDRAALLEQLHSWGRRSAEMEKVTKALHGLYGGTRGDEIAGHLVTALLMRAVGLHESGLNATTRKLSSVLERLLEDREALRRAGGTVRSRTAMEADLHTLQSSLQELRTFEQTVQFMLRDSETDLRTAVRSQLETAVGLKRSYAPVPPPGVPVTRPAGPPRIAAATGPAAVKAGAQLFEAIEKHPPAPRPPTPAQPGRGAPAKPYTAREMGRQSKQVKAAALTFVAAFRAEHGDRAIAAAVKALLAGTGDAADRNRMVIAVLQAEGRIRPGGAVARGTAHGLYQERITGTPFEWVAELQRLVRGFRTVGVDGIVDGWVRDAKHSKAIVAESGHFRGRVPPGKPLLEKPPPVPHGEPAPAPAPKAGKGGRPRRRKPQSDEIQRGFPNRDRPWEKDVTPDVESELRGRPPLTARELIAVHEERAGIKLGAEMERHLAFAHENGLRGVEWVAATPELRNEFERIFRTEVGAVPKDVQMSFTVGRE
ncbi:hypothetical protein AB0F30_27505 [Streptomyces sp. NPDC029006]|uniref:hypothetical protein n=1 Tax=Streptomyces sp. NPDC029006 TaxID=3155467 RepID=UPI0034058025